MRWLPFLLLVSCAAPAAKDTRVCSDSLRLEIDSLFTPNERAEILVAVGNWREAAEGKVCIDTDWRDTSGDKKSYKTDGKHVIYSPRGPWQVATALAVDRNPCTLATCIGVTIWEIGGGSSDIFIFTTNLANIRSITEHELGHMFGLPHNDDYDSIMYQSVAADKRIRPVDKRNLACLIRDRMFLKHGGNCAR